MIIIIGAIVPSISEFSYDLKSRERKETINNYETIMKVKTILHGDNTLQKQQNGLLERRYFKLGGQGKPL